LGAPSRVTYEIDGQFYEVAVPGAGQSPRMAYASCNGFSNPKYMKGITNKNAVWDKMKGKHDSEPYHLLLFGGDQIYADSIWDTAKSIGEWNKLDTEEGNKRKFTSKMQSEVEHFYMDLYTDRWSQPSVKRMLAQIPMVAMWDDHDVFDGWGSWPEQRQNCDVFQGIGRNATKAFAVFQQHIKEGEAARAYAIGPQYGFSFGHVVGRIGIVAIDMRSQRSGVQVLSDDHWKLIYAWLDNIKKGCLDHLLIMSSIPVVYPGFDTLEALLGVVPGYQDLEDDLRDHWNSQPHKGERIRMVHNLLDFTDEKQIPATILSGDVHVAALGLIESTAAHTGKPVLINQLISSGIVHPGPGAAVLFCLKHLFDSEDDIEPGLIKARMTDFPGNTGRFIGQRNYLSLEPDDKKRIWANWIVENNPHPFTKVLLPFG